MSIFRSLQVYASKLKKDLQKKKVFSICMVFCTFAITYSSFFVIIYSKPQIPAYNRHCIIICERTEVCCGSMLSGLLKSVFSQSLPFDSISLFHACVSDPRLHYGENEARFHSINYALIDDMPTVIKKKLDSGVLFRYWKYECRGRGIEECVGAYINNYLNIKSSGNLQSVLFISNTQILKKTAHESLYLQSILKPDVLAFKPRGYSYFENGKSYAISALSQNSSSFLPMFLSTKGIKMHFIKNSNEANKKYGGHKRIFVEILEYCIFLSVPLYTSIVPPNCGFFCYEKGIVVKYQEETKQTHDITMHSEKVLSRKSWSIQNRELSSKNNYLNIQNQKIRQVIRYPFTGPTTRQTEIRITFFVSLSTIGENFDFVLDTCTKMGRTSMPIVTIIFEEDVSIQYLKISNPSFEIAEKFEGITSDILYFSTAARESSISSFILYLLQSRTPDIISISAMNFFCENIKHIIAYSAKHNIVVYNNYQKNNESGLQQNKEINCSRGFPKLSHAHSMEKVENNITIGIKSFICCEGSVKLLRRLLRSIRLRYPHIMIFVANDGSISLKNYAWFRRDKNSEEIWLRYDSGISNGRNVMVRHTRTKYFLLLDDDHTFDTNIDLYTPLKTIESSHFDIIGFRVYNGPGVQEWEESGYFIPRYVALVSKFKNRHLELCLWDENTGPSLNGLHLPVPVDILHNAFLAKTNVLRKNPWRNHLKVNEHMTFFLDAREKEIKVGYLPTIYVHHKARIKSSCYNLVRKRELMYKHLTAYNTISYDKECGKLFPDYVRKYTNNMSTD